MNLVLKPPPSATVFWSVLLMSVVGIHSINVITFMNEPWLLSPFMLCYPPPPQIHSHTPSVSHGLSSPDSDSSPQCAQLAAPLTTTQKDLIREVCSSDTLCSYDRGLSATLWLFGVVSHVDLPLPWKGSNNDGLYLPGTSKGQGTTLHMLNVT